VNRTTPQLQFVGGPMCCCCLQHHNSRCVKAGAADEWRPAPAASSLLLDNCEPSGRQSSTAADDVTNDVTYAVPDMTVSPHLLQLLLGQPQHLTGHHTFTRRHPSCGCPVSKQQVKHPKHHTAAAQQQATHHVPFDGTDWQHNVNSSSGQDCCRMTSNAAQSIICTRHGAAQELQAPAAPSGMWTPDVSGQGFDEPAAPTAPSNLALTHPHQHPTSKGTARDSKGLNNGQLGRAAALSAPESPTPEL